MRPGCGVAIAFFLVWFIVSLIAETAFGAPGVFCVRVVSIVVGFALLPGILRDLRLRKQLKAPSASEVLAHDKRPPIIYLRSFKEEGTGKDLPATLTVEPLMNPLGFGGRQMPTFEQELAVYVERSGPFVTLHNPDFGLSELGAARLATKEGNDWWKQLDEVLPGCRFVIFRAGETKNLLLELQKLVSEVPATKVLVYLQMGVEQDAGVQQARYNRFRKLTESILPKPLPEKRGKYQFLYFDPDWTPILSRNLKTTLIQKNIPFERNSLRHSLKKFFPYADVNLESPGVANRNQIASLLARPYLTRLTGLVAIGCLVGLIFGGLYGFVEAVNPLPALNVVPLAVCAAITGILTGLSGRYLVLPGGRVYLFAGLLSGLSLVYLNWVIWASLRNDALILDPRRILNTMSAFVALLDSLPGFTGNGIVLWCIWIFETSVGICVTALSAWTYGLSRFEYTETISPQIATP